MATAWRVAHRMEWSARGVLFSGGLVFTLLSLLVTLVPAGLVLTEAREVTRLGEQLSRSAGGLAPEVVFVALAWGGVGLLAVPWAWLVRKAWQATSEQYRDLFGAHRFVEGSIERVEVRGRGSRRRALIHVGGAALHVRLLDLRALRVGMVVRARATRFNDLVLDLAVPEEVAPGGPGASGSAR